ncbi:P-loop containing nucleoside triphosphate hydrolase protein [Biscogniauxia marginata]|nr:P-loop containing nucleoside triphosphate hydrolase protein [Biscogniauxia marginata]
MGRIALLEAENNEFKEAQKDTARSETLYFIQIDARRNYATYLDEPTWAIGPRGEAVLKAHFPIHDISGYLNQKHDVAFVILKFYDWGQQGKIAQKAFRDKKALPRPQSSAQTIRLQSHDMIEAAEEFFAKQPKFLEEFPGFNIRGNLEAPYLFWYHYRSPEAFEGLSVIHKKMMTLLTSWIDENYGGLYARVESQLKRGVISAETMAFLVKPGDVLLWKEKRDTMAVIARSWPVSRTPPPLKSLDKKTDWRKSSNTTEDAPTWKWSVSAWQYDYDGSFFRKKRSMEIQMQSESFEEEIPIQKLTIYPLKYAGEDIKSTLEARGKTFWSCRFQRLVSYKDDRSVYGSGERFMIDFHTYEQLHSDSWSFKKSYPSIDDPECERMDASMMSSDEPPPVPEIYVFPKTIVGYNLRNKKWVDLEVDLIQDVSWNKKSFEHLVVDIETKDLVQALVTNQIEREQSTDIIDRKGNGLIILLHGGPGTGKTFTAESVAEMCEKPLFRVTCGDIGTKPEDVEKYLESVLHLGKSWGCVVLLDEADVFLEQRTLTDLERNALVSVFLRVLEYYEGILILTSNRVGTFDEAFKSRIQLSLHYENLTKGQRSKIWRNFLNRLKDLDGDLSRGLPRTNSGLQQRKPMDPTGIDFEDVECYLSDLAEFEMNGRQIRNAITTARQLAKFKDEPMSYHHLKHVITVSSKFDAYLKTVQEGFSDDQVARGDGIR